jgi:hypothetical protein
METYKIEKAIMSKMAELPRTPSGLCVAIDAAFPPESQVAVAWKRYCHGPKKRIWKGIEAAAKAMAARANFDAHVLEIATEKNLLAVANAILLALPQISGPAWRDRRKRGEEWAQIDFCDRCWRLAPAGATTNRRPPLCEKHKPRTPEYQRQSRLKTGLPAALAAVKEALAIGGGLQAVKPLLPAEVLDALPHLNQHAKAGGINPAVLPDLLKLLLQDVKDSPDGKIRSKTEEWSRGGEWAAGTLIHAEAWLALAATRSHGGKRPRAGRPKLNG